MKIIFPELSNPKIKEALEFFPDIEPVNAENLTDACQKLNSNIADSIIAGIDYSSRDVLLSFKDNIELRSEFFSSCFVCLKDGKILLIADGGVNKLPTKEQLYCTVKDTAETFEKCFGLIPKIAMLSYSTKGSGGKNPDLEKIYYCIDKIRENFPNYLIDGEMQLDAAVDPEIGNKKCPDSKVAGEANILIVPDLNSGNILYKSLEHLGGWTVGGPIIQSFKYPLGDLSRGSSVSDIKLTIDVIKRLCERSK